MLAGKIAGAEWPHASGGKQEGTFDPYLIRRRRLALKAFEERLLLLVGQRHQKVTVQQGIDIAGVERSGDTRIVGDRDYGGVSGAASSRCSASPPGGTRVRGRSPCRGLRASCTTSLAPCGIIEGREGHPRYRHQARSCKCGHRRAPGHDVGVQAVLRVARKFKQTGSLTKQRIEAFSGAVIGEARAIG